MKYAVWGRPLQGTREWLLATFWTRDQAEQYRSEVVVNKMPLRGGAGDQVCEVAVVEDYDGNSAIDEGRPIKKPSKYKPRYQRMVTEIGPSGIKRLVRQEPGKPGKSRKTSKAPATATAEV